VLRYGRFFMILDSQHISIGAPGSFNRIEPNKALLQKILITYYPVLTGVTQTPDKNTKKPRIISNNL
jgi:hypothetical protein